MDIAKYNFFKQLCNLDFIEKIILYGSRARQDNQQRSDIDIAISYQDLNDKNWLQIEEIIENADTLLKIDYIRIEDLKDESELKKNILKEGKILYEKSKN